MSLFIPVRETFFVDPDFVDPDHDFSTGLFDEIFRFGDDSRDFGLWWQYESGGNLAPQHDAVLQRQFRPDQGIAVGRFLHFYLENL